MVDGEGKKGNTGVEIRRGRKKIFVTTFTLEPTEMRSLHCTSSPR